MNFIKQFVGAGLSKDMTLYAPGFSADEDVIRAVGESMLGTFNTRNGHMTWTMRRTRNLWLISRRNLVVCPLCMHRTAMTLRS